MTVTLDSLRSQKSALLALAFAVNTFLSSTYNGRKSTDSNVFVSLNVTGLYNPN